MKRKDKRGEERREIDSKSSVVGLKSAPEAWFNHCWNYTLNYLYIAYLFRKDHVIECVFKTKKYQRLYYH